MNEIPYAEDVPYFGTGRSAPDSWIDRTIAEIVRAGGTVEQHASGTDIRTGRAAYMISFVVDGEHFRITWPVLPTRKGNETAARIQAATFIYHDVKAKCVKARIFGMRTAFFEHLLLSDGREAAQHTSEQLAGLLPDMAIGAKRITQQ